LSGRNRSARAGFTLIEVMAAMLIFSTGVLMLLSVTSGLSSSLEHSAISSLITAEGQERMDSLMAVGYPVLSGTSTDTLTYRGIRYRRNSTVSQYSPLVKKVDVSIAPLSGFTGPSWDASSYKADVW
jgi:prepilin-type N-terminal cleavage/methylation domain-containing protein